jgi:ornithine carbamoyltransferase
MHEDPYFQDSSKAIHSSNSNVPSLTPLRPLTITWLGDSSNVLHDMLVSFPRLGHKMRVATPPNPAYRCPDPVWNRVKELGCDKDITWTDDPREAVHGADLVITDTWYGPLSCVLFAPLTQN